jgi:plastocyanin
VPVRARILPLAAAIALLVVGPAAAGSASTRSTTVDVKAKDFSFVLSKSVVHSGTVTFVIRNDGHSDHNFAIAGHDSKTIGPGKTTRLTVTLKAGKYPYKCTVDSHATLGMKGVLRVT